MLTQLQSTPRAPSPRRQPPSRILLPKHVAFRSYCMPLTTYPINRDACTINLLVFQYRCDTSLTCLFCCPNAQTSRGRRRICHLPAQRNVIGYNNIASSIMLMKQKLDDSCTSFFLSKCCSFLLFYFIFTRTTLRSGLCCRNSFCLSVCLSVVCLSSVTLVHPTHGVEAFGNISSLLCTLAIL